MNTSISGNGICGSVHCRNLECLRTVDRCIVILGNFTFIYLGTVKKDLFEGITFPDLKEVTGYMAIYQVPVLESIGELFPNLVRIRGRELLYNYALIICNMNQLSEIGLYSLLKIDRGGVIIWGGPNTCYIDTVDWKTIAPRYRHVLSPVLESYGLSYDITPCKRVCSCTGEAEFNYCWNAEKCQRYTEGPEALECHEECLGCRLTASSECMICRHYTYKQQCVSKCPDNTIILEDNQYCITEEECLNLGRWVWNNTCVNSCPDDYVERNITIGKNNKVKTCKHCPFCKQYCGSISIKSLGSIQAAHRCIYINGSLTIHIRGDPEAIDEMRIHLSKIQEVYDYVSIYESVSLTRIDFLPSLQRIHGRKLFDNTYSLMIRDNPNLQTVFLPNVTKNLQIDTGSMDILRNPMLCMSEIEKLKKLFPGPRLDDIPHGPGLNSYNSGCEHVSLGLKVSEVDLTSAVLIFMPLLDAKINYTVLYARVPPGKYGKVVPEACSEYEWQALTPNKPGRVQLKNLRPASTYLVSIESYNDENKHLARSSIVNFSTPAGKPEPPFLVELVADTPHLVVLHWVDHVDYLPHITHYELSVSLVDIYAEDIAASNQCKNVEEVLEEVDAYMRHAMVMRPPPNYGKACESMCGILSTAPHGALVEEDFDICHSMGSACNEIDEEPSVGNTSFGYFIRTISLNVSGPREGYQVGNLAPYRDYRFRLRACINDQCSRSTRGVVRTLPSQSADVPTMTTVEDDKTGLVMISWEAPIVSNGPVLVYILKMITDIHGMGVLQTETWCMPANQTKLVVKCEKGKKYIVQLCSLSLASRPGCTEVRKLFATKQHPSDWLWAGVCFAVSLCVVSLLIGYVCTRCKAQSDSVPLVDITSTYRIDSEPPIFSLLDFTPSFHVSRVNLHDIYGE